jgi:hypothetical protein
MLLLRDAHCKSVVVAAKHALQPCCAWVRLGWVQLQVSSEAMHTCQHASGMHCVLRTAGRTISASNSASQRRGAVPWRSGDTHDIISAGATCMLLPRRFCWFLGCVCLSQGHAAGG